ncbi:MAG: hypothetical protein KAJ90_04710 [Desulfobacterales bacterium]|nr:hypothetical protein [Desulfobacterales bacterium]
MAVSDYLVPLLEEAEIAHHIPGRIRLRFNHSILAKLPNLNGLEKEILRIGDQVKAFNDIRLNLHAGSVTIQYDTNLLPPDFWEEAVGEQDVERLRQTAQRFLPDLKF